MNKVILNINVLYTDIKLRVFKQLNCSLIVSLMLRPDLRCLEY